MEMSFTSPHQKVAFSACDPGYLIANNAAVHASVPANTFAIYGQGEDKELTELVPGILNQLGPDSLASLRKLAESYQSMQKEKGEDGDKKDDDEDEDDIPDLVAGDTFEGKGADVE
jgi:nascent polypeptide-associated complex subunit beta